MKTNHILLTTALLLCAASCTKEATEIPDTVDDNALYPVTFSGGIDLVQTKTEATSTMRSGVKATVYVYADNATVSSATALASKEYTVGDNGDLTIGTSDTIYLAKGAYDIYAVAIDTLSGLTFPTFTSGEFLALNDSNYLWTKVDQTITGTATKQNVALQFKRKAVMIAINIVAASGITIDSWGSSDPAMITPPDPGTTCKMALSTGTITPATTVLTKTYAMKTGTVEGSEGSKTTSVSYIMLPLADQNSPVPTVTLKIKVKNTGESAAQERTYTTKLNYPTSGFESGKKYTYTATLKANGITFSSATVEDWTEGTLGEGDGNLTPTEPDGGS